MDLLRGPPESARAWPSRWIVFRAHRSHVALHCTMAKRRSDIELTSYNVGAFLEENVGRSHSSAPGVSFDRADSATLQSRRLLQASNAFSPPPAEGSSGNSNPFSNVRLTASSSTDVPTSSIPGGFSFGTGATADATGNLSEKDSVSQLSRQFRERILQLANPSNAQGEHMGSWMGLMLQFSKEWDRLNPTPATLNAVPTPPNLLPPPAVTAVPPTSGSVGVSFGSFAPPPRPPPAVALPPASPAAPVASAMVPGTEDENEEEEETTAVARLTDPDWRDVAEYEPVRFYGAKPGDGVFKTLGSGRLRLEQHVQKPEARMVLRDGMGKTLLCLRISQGQKFILTEPDTKPGKKKMGRVDFLGTTERGVEKLAIQTAWPGASELHQKLQELAR
jgi:hypothetical protein